jgi:tetratricopeptide (TPR) repeat protein
VRELRELLDAFEDAERGHGAVQLVLGDPGIGKTRLAAALAEHAAACGATVIWTRGWGRSAPAYWPWVEVVRTLCQALDDRTLCAKLGAGADQLLRLAPELADRLAGGLPTAGEDSEIARFALFDALVALLRARSAVNPVVVLIDDLQAVDEGSLVALDFVSRMLRDAAVLLVVTMHERVPEQTPDAQLALANVVRAGRRLVRGGLTRDDVGRLIELTSGGAAPPALTHALHAVTEGNPFFAREILALLLAEGRLHDPPDELPLPDGVRETIRRRLQPLGRQAVEMLELAAIVGRRFSLSALESASTLDRDAVLAALDATTGLGLVVPIPGSLGQYRFSHGLIGETLLAGMPAARRMAGHRAVGEALEQLYRGAIDAHLAELAHHFLFAAPQADLGRALDYAQRAADQALDNLAYEQAADLYARALQVHERLELDISQRARLLLGLGTAQSGACRQAARDTFMAAAAAARSIQADDLLARAALGSSPFGLTAGTVDEVHVALLVEALDRIGPEDSALRVRLLGSLAVALYWSGPEQRRLELSRQALEMARRLGDDAAIGFALASTQLARSGPDRTAEGLELLRELFALSEWAGDAAITMAARSRHVDILLELDDLSAADTAIETLERLAQEARDRRASASVPLHRASRAALEGRFGDARLLVDEVAAMTKELEATTVPLAVDAANIVLIWLQKGLREVRELVRAYADGAPAMPCWRAGLAAALAASGRREEALLEFERLVADDFAALPRDTLWLGAMALLTETVAALDLRERAMEVHDKLAPFADRNVVFPTSGLLHPVQMWLGILARVARRPEQALEHLAAARAAATRNGARTSLVRISVEEAAALVDDGSAAACARAGALLDAAVDECEEIGLSAMLERVGPIRARLQRAAPTAAQPTAAAQPAAPTMRRVGDVWTIEVAGRTLHLNNGRGVRLLALLLVRPGEEIHCLDLVAAVDGLPPAGPRVQRSGGQETSGRFGVQGGAGPTLDVKAKAAYRARIAALEEEIAEAQSLRDGARAGRARAELEFVGRELERAVGIGGRDRECGSHAERARVNVTRAIRSTLKRIAAYDDELGRELQDSVRTGTFCVYEPGPRWPGRWHVDDGGAR